MRKLDSITLHFDRASPIPIMHQIANHLRHMIGNGDLKTNTRLPSTRSLARDLGLSRPTIVAAYEQLAAEGFLDGRKGAGHFVTMNRFQNFETLRAPPRPTTREPTASAILLFQPCVPDPQLFPAKEWAQTVSRVARRFPEALSFSDHMFGDHRLRAVIAVHVEEWRGIRASPDQIIITAGTEDAISLLLETLGRPGMKVGMENPGYLPVRAIASRLGMVAEWLSVGADGAELPSKNCDFAVLTPSHQFPLGGAMPLERRSAFLEWANRNDAWIIEDDYDSEFRYAGQPIPAMAGLDRNERTIYVGTFSKTFSPDIRIGYLIVPNVLTDRLATVISERPLRASVMPQRPLAEFMEDGAFHRHLRRVRRNYAQRRDALLGIIEAALGPQPRTRAHKGGMQIAIAMGDRFDDQALSQRAAKLGLGLEPLSKYCAGTRCEPGLLIGFCAHSIEQMEAGFPILARLLNA